MTIPYGRQAVSQDDIAAVVEVLQSDYLTQGPAVPAFERALCAYTGAGQAVAVNSATSALHLACLALGLGPGDWLWTSPTTFVASANCALYCGAQVDFIDIDPKTYNISVEQLSLRLQQAEKTGRLPKVVVAVHLCGQSCEMEAIYQLSQRYDFHIIEDASHAIGGRYQNQPVGNGQYSDITIFSFHPVKIVTTAEGGAALTNRPELAERMRLLRSHGISNDPDLMEPRPVEEIWNYQQVALGFNYRMTDLQAALGLSQLKRLDEFVERRQILAQGYDLQLAGLPIRCPWQHPDSDSSYHLYPVRVDASQQRAVYEGMRAVGIEVNLHYIPVYRQPYYARMGFAAGYCPEAEAYFHQAISLPLYASLEDQQQDQVITRLRELCS